MHLYIFSLILLCPTINIDVVQAEKICLDPNQAQEIAIQVYHYAYSLITSEVTRVQMTNVATLQQTQAPMGQFLNSPYYPPASYHGVTTPNDDTLYSIAWLDLDAQPWVFSHPNMNNRYYLFPMYNLWMPVIDSPGTRTAGTDAATYLLTGPKWNGTLSNDVEQLFTQQIASPTRYFLILGRTYCTGTTEDYAIVDALQGQYLLQPLSNFLNITNETVTYPVNPDPGFSMNDTVRDVINNMSISTYFNMLTNLTQDNPPLEQDGAIVAKMAQLGLFPGQEFDLDQYDLKVQNALQQVPQLAYGQISAQQGKAGVLQNDWLISNIIGQYGTDYLRRAVVAAFGWPANLPEDAIYPATSVDSDGNSFSGENQYLMHFAANQTPPVNSFWSITMYDSDFFFVPNSLNRYSLSPRDSLIYSPDGSLNLYFQYTAPVGDLQDNWLPAPQGPFILFLRMYWPIFDNFWVNDSWVIPPVVKLP